MKLINCESPIFTNVNIIPVIQILGDIRLRARSSLRPFPSNNFLIHIDKLVKDIGKPSVFHLQKFNNGKHLTIGVISD
jgi:hypothetical protein